MINVGGTLKLQIMKRQYPDDWLITINNFNVFMHAVQNSTLIFPESWSLQNLQVETPTFCTNVMMKGQNFNQEVFEVRDMYDTQ